MKFSFPDSEKVSVFFKCTRVRYDNEPHPRIGFFFYVTPPFFYETLGLHKKGYINFFSSARGLHKKGLHKEFQDLRGYIKRLHKQFLIFWGYIRRLHKDFQNYS